MDGSAIDEKIPIAEFNLVAQAATGVTDRYVHSNAQRKDQLTAYNGVTFTYDSIGNPAKYNNGSATSRYYYIKNLEGTLSP